MADYYTSMSIEIELPDEAIDWTIELLDYLGKDTPPKDPTIAAAAELFGDDTYAGVIYKKTGPGKLWIYDDESVNLDVLTGVLQATLEKFEIKECITIEWANTCSKHVTDGFGGGAAIVTRHGTIWMSTYDWIQETVSKLYPEKS